MSGKLDEVKLTAVMILEVMGRPKEHLIETLQKLLTQIKEEKGLEIISQKVNDPVLVKDQKDLFITFAEIEIEVDDPLLLAILMFKYMPSHMEIIEPEKFIMTDYGFGDILNELTRRLHRYEELIRVVQMQLEAQGKGFSQILPAEAPKEEDKKVNKKESPKKKSKSKK